MSNLIVKLLFKLAFKVFKSFTKLYFLNSLVYLFITCSLKLILELKLEFTLIPFSRLNLTSPSDIFTSSIKPKIFLIKISFLSAKKLRSVFFKIILLNSSAFKFFTVPFAIKSLIKPFLFKNISISN